DITEMSTCVVARWAFTDIPNPSANTSVACDARRKRKDPRAISRASFDHDPVRLEQWESDQSDNCRRADQQRVADLETEHDREAAQPDQHREPIADRDFAEQHASPEDGADRRGISALDETLNIRVVAMAREDRRDGKDQDEGGQEDSDRR